MFIEPLRSEVDRLRAEISNLPNAPTEEELGWAFTDPETFKFWYYGNQGVEDYEITDGWDTCVHRDYYFACINLKRAEAEEYKKAMQWSAA